MSWAGCIFALTAAACSREEDAAGPAVSDAGSAVVDEEPASGRGFLDPNLATAAALTALPVMADSITLAVIAGRPYTSMPALDKVLARHMSAQWRDSIYTHVWIPLDLNTASSEEIDLIPGVDTRLRHELEEYRPYDDINAFRRAIGVRLGAEETVRLERYITLP